MRFRQARTLNDWKKIKTLYLEAFPAYERKPLGLIWLTQKRGLSHVWCIEEAGVFVGLAITINVKDLVLLDYFAIDKSRRGGGLGTKSLRMLQRHYAGKKFFLEIESVYEKVDNLEERKRRKAFYLSNGMEEMKVMVNLFGTNMELLGYDCQVDFARYCSVYECAFGKRIARNVQKRRYPR